MLRLIQRLLLLVAFYLVQVHAQSLSCTSGSVAFIRCYIDRQGYISDVQFRSNPSQTTSSSTVCQSTQQQLAATSPDDIYLAVGAYITSVVVCADAGGVRGLVVETSLQESYSCGSHSSGCLVQNGWSALGGFAANCISTDEGLKRVVSLEDLCWTPNYTPTTTPNACPAGQGSPGGGIGCKMCPVGQYSDSLSGMCVPCPPGSYTLQDGQSSCGCLPGYGTTEANPYECQPCPSGTYSSGMTMSSCTNCLDGFDSQPGSPSLRFCVCKAGTGLALNSTLPTCKACAKGYYSQGPFTQRIFGDAGTANGSDLTTVVQTGIPAGDLALRSAIYDAQELATAPASNKCTYCGAGYTTAAPGATSKNACIVDENGSGTNCSGTGQDLYDGVCVCIPGYQPVGDGTDDCQQCSSGSFKSDPGDTACLPCPDGQSSSSDRTSCVTGPAPPPAPPGPSPPPPPPTSPRPPSPPQPPPTPPPSPPPSPGTCANDCVTCDIDYLITDIEDRTQCDPTDPESVLVANSYCTSENTDTPTFNSDPPSILGPDNGGIFGGLICAEIKKVTQFSLTTTDTSSSSCKSKPLTCVVKGYTFS